MNNYNYMMYNLPRANENELYNPREGFIKGNLFEDLYQEYKNYKPISLKPRNEQEEKLFELQAISFAAHEINLYLDTHPQDQSMLMLYNDYVKKCNELTKEYESLYGPMMVSNNNDMNNFNWVNNNWPWEVKNV